MEKKVVVLPQHTTAFEAARAMYEKNIGSVLVSNGHGEIIGIVTDRDLACGILGLNLSGETPINDVMSPNPRFVNADDFTPGQIINIMQKNAIRRVPVIKFSRSGSQKCVGIYTVDDFLLNNDVTFSSIRAVIRKQLRPPTKNLTHNERRELHKEQTLARFHKITTAPLGTSREAGEQITLFLLKSLVERIPPSSAGNFIAELPSLLQEDLLALRSGPNRQITRSSIEQALVQKFPELRDHHQLLAKFWMGLEAAIPTGVLSHVLANLPKDIQLGLTETEPRKKAV